MKFIKKYKQNLLVLLLFTLAVAIFYGNTLKNDFVFDNHDTIEHNPYVTSLKYIPRVFTSAPFLYYRPLLSISDIVTYQISPKPWMFHLVNLIYFAADVFLVFLLAKLLTKKSLVGIFAALLFLIHPINTEAVNWVSVPDLLSTVFILLTVICYFLYRTKPKAKYLVYTGLLYACGIFSKEPAILVPAMFLVLDLFYFKKKVSALFQWKNLKPYIISLAILIFCLGLRFYFLHGLGGAGGVTHNFTAIQKVYLFFYSFALYVQKLFWPIPLSDLYNAPTIFNFLSAKFFTYVFVFIMYICLCFLAWKKHWFSTLFGLIWFLIFLLPSLLFLNALVVTFAERYLFTPVVGFSIIVAALLGQLWKKGKNAKVLIIVILSVISLASFVVIYQRNNYWVDDINIYKESLKKEPNSDAFNYDLAVAYLNKGDSASAEKIFKEMIKLGTGGSLYKVYNNLGNIYRKKGDLNQAIKYYQSSIKLNPKHKESYNNLGAQYVERGYLLESLPYLCKALLIEPSFKDANTNFDFVSSRIQGLDNKSFTLLHNQMLQGDIFKPALVKDNITLQNKDCSYQQGCILTFNANLKQNEFLFPFLIYASTPMGEVVRIRYSAFNQTKAGYQIALGIDHQFGNSAIHFYIPTCDGIYYETNVK